MSKYAWCSDIHLDHLSSEDQIVGFSEQLVSDNPTGIFITGDVSNAKQLVYHLSVMERIIQRPIYFVLGNHDYYGGDIEGVRKTMRELHNISPFLKYMPTLPYIGLSPVTAVVGHDGWYDALNGDWQKSRFIMSDWGYIHDFVPHSGGPKFLSVGNVAAKGGIVSLSRSLAHAGVMHVMDGIKSAVRYHKNVIVLTHFPPFAESHLHEGKMGDDHAQPWFTSKLMGDMLLDAARAYPGVNFTVLAGHTHGKYDGEFNKNLRVHVAGAEYGRPQLASSIEVS